MASAREIVLVTGATDGIGQETARQLVQRGADVIVHGRREKRAEEVRAELAALAKRPMPAALIGDLASLAAVRRLAVELNARTEPVTVLLHNAGIFQKKRELTEDGFEKTMAVNHLAPFLLTHLVLADPRCAVRRIVLVSSMAHFRGSVDVNDVGLVRRTFDGYGHYGASKLANVLTARALAPRLASRGITANALHPGVVSTKLLTAGFGMRGSDTLEDSARTSVKLAIDPALDGVTGEYFAHERRADASPAARDEGLVEAFYLASAKAVGITPL
jgi:NAD(P)-dependent dehydrogenase (short-subunit alcohol dehydrogenase family)